MTRLPRVLLLPVAFVVLTAGCSGDNPYQASKAAETSVATASTDTAGTDTTGTGLADNGFIPDEQNVSSCVGTNERPNCGSKSKGGWRMYLVFAALAGGVGFGRWAIGRIGAAPPPAHLS